MPESDIGGKNTGAVPRLRIGVSSCLLGEKVRYDGRDKRHSGILNFVGPKVDWVPVCPEVEMGLGVPREPVKLAGEPSCPRLLGEESGKDLTDEMTKFSSRRLDELRRMDLDGFILKKNSPSCGTADVPVYKDSLFTELAGRSSGMFARYLMRAFPGLPVVDEDAVADEAGAGHFLERVRRFKQRKGY